MRKSDRVGPPLASLSRRADSAGVVDSALCSTELEKARTRDRVNWWWRGFDPRAILRKKAGGMDIFSEDLCAECRRQRESKC